MPREAAERCEMWTKEREGPGSKRERNIEEREATRKQ